jgi:hypothetical protein
MLLLLTLAGCAGTKDDTGPVDDGLPHITIVSPDASADVGSCFTVTVEIVNFDLVSYIENPTPVDGEGHWILDFGDHYFVCETLDCDLDLTGQASGPVTLLAELVGNDHNRVLDADGEMISDTEDVNLVQDDCAPDK